MGGGGNNLKETQSVRGRDLGNWWTISMSGEDCLKWGFHGLRIGVDAVLRSMI